MDTVTIILPVSRESYLSRVFYGLENLICDTSKTNLICIVDGNDDLFVKTRNLVETSRFNERLCIPFSNKDMPALTIPGRRHRIADIHNELKTYVGDCKYVFGIEDDTVIPSNTLKLLLEDYSLNPYAGFIEGVEVGRWGTTYIGGWLLDDIYDPQSIKSIMPEGDKSVVPVDAGGFYCFMTPYSIYKDHNFKVFGNNSMGPDFEFGQSLRKEGYSNYIDWRISCLHLNGKDILSLDTCKIEQAVFMKTKGYRWSFSKA